MMNGFDIPVVLFVFRRLDTVKMIMEKLKEIQPRELYVFSDGPREGREDEKQKVLEVREYIKGAVDWECNAHLEFSEKNKGCAGNICGGIDEVFGREEAAIILEDDAVPTTDFFRYCRYLLIKYKEEKKIQFIAGFNAVGDSDIIQNGYAFSKSAPMSGAIATWEDRWNNCDFAMKNWPDHYKNGTFKKYFYFGELYRTHCEAFEDSYKNVNDGWDYQFHHDMLDKERFAIVPKGNLVKSYGYAEGAFHPQSRREAENLKKIMDYTAQPVAFESDEPDEIGLNENYDKLRQKYLLNVKGNYLQRHVYYFKRKVKDIAYRYMPRGLWNRLKKMCTKA